MATFTTNLRLRLSDDLTADARYNLERIDLLGTTLDFSGDSDVILRSSSGVTILPNSPELGGSGTGGTISLGTASQSADDILLFATNITFEGNVNLETLRVYDADESNYIQLTAPALSSNVSFILPASDGTSGQVLQTDGSGALSFTTIDITPIASAVEVTPFSGVSSDNVQDALEELQDNIEAVEAGDVTSVNGQSGVVVLDTDDIAEAGNLYYTTGRFNSALSTKTTADLVEGSNLYYTSSRFNTAFAAKTTADLTENTNLYYTAARFNTAFSSKSTTDLSEGSNLYYTNGRADARIAAASIEDLSDVAAMTPTNGDVLTWDTDHWEATAPTSGGTFQFSTSASVNTGLTWIDGKPIYTKVFAGTTPNASDTFDIIFNHGLNIDKYIPHMCSAYVDSIYGGNIFGGTNEDATKSGGLTNGQTNQVSLCVKCNDNRFRNENYHVIIAYTLT